MQKNGQNGQYKKWQKNRASNCTLLVCSDIFGISAELQAFCQDWRGELLLLSPYSQQQHFSNDEKAYQYFQQQGGLDSYRKKLQQTLRQLATLPQSQQQTVIAVGFSAGAAALWCELGFAQNSKTPSKNRACVVQQAFCFYGGQIRHFAQLNPCCPTTLIWAQESHFDVNLLAAALADKHNVSNSLCRYNHGFINPQSGGYHKQGAAYYQRWLMSRLHQLHSAPAE